MSAKANKKAKATPNFLDTITANAKVASKSKAKAKDDSILEPPSNIKDDIKTLKAAKATAKKAKSDISLAEKSIIEFGRNHKDAQAFAGNFNKSYKIAGHGDETVTFVTANKWSLNTDDINEINEIIGDAANEMLPATYNVKVKAEVFTDEEKQQELMELLGDRWTDFFETTVSYKPCDDFDKKIYSLGKDKVDDLSVYMKQSKPSIRG
jgi:hypothetical protein